MISFLQLRSFRSFVTFDCEINNKILLIEGINGSGKTSLLEALYYACYLKSFRTHIQKELLHFASDTFFIKIKLINKEEQHTVQVGYSSLKRVVKVDDRPISSYKELLKYYRVISITEDDLELIKGSPELRRNFLDQAIVLSSPDYVHDLKKFRTVLDNRNGVLKTPPFNAELYRIWTEQFIAISIILQSHRIKFLELLLSEVATLLGSFFGPNHTVKFHYRNKKIDLFQKIEILNPKIKEFIAEELRFGRSCFGAHLDDFDIIFQEKNSRIFASRGQQKLLLFLIKLAQVRLLSYNTEDAIILIDDFMTDFDEEKIKIICSMLVATNNQLIFTSPTFPSPLQRLLEAHAPQHLKLTN